MTEIPVHENDEEQTDDEIEDEEPEADEFEETEEPDVEMEPDEAADVAIEDGEPASDPSDEGELMGLAVVVGFVGLYLWLSRDESSNQFGI